MVELPTVVTMVTSLPLFTFVVRSVQTALGEFISPRITDTLQVSVYISPALELPDLLILTWTASRGTEDIRQTVEDIILKVKLK